MAPGSAWSASDGFAIAPFDYDDLDSYLALLEAEHGHQVEERVEEDAAEDFDVQAFTAYFERFSRGIPRAARHRLGAFEFRIVEHGTERFFTIDPLRHSVAESVESASASFSIRCQAAVINDCARYDMFSVWTPSKRLSIRVADRAAVATVLLFFSLLDGIELDYLPLRRNVSKRMIVSSLRRWREPAQAIRTLVTTKVLRRPFVPWPVE